MVTETEIGIVKGTKVLTSAGLQGVINIKDNGEIVVEYANGTKDFFLDENALFSETSRFYSIGSHFYGNKIPRTILAEAFERQKSVVETEKRRLEFLRKQLAVYDNKMPDEINPTIYTNSLSGELLTQISSVINYNMSLLPYMPAPGVSVLSSDRFDEPDTKCVLSSDGENFLINSDAWKTHTDMDVWIYISRVCRLLWQTASTEYAELNALYSDKYDIFEENADEIDAWAWTCIVCKMKLKAIPNVPKLLGDDLWNKIQDRINFIKSVTPSLKNQK